MTEQKSPSKAQQLFAKARAEARKEAAEARDLDTKRKIILGGTVIAATRDDPEFGARFAVLLDKYIKPADRKHMSEWLPQRPPE